MGINSSLTNWIMVEKIQNCRFTVSLLIYVDPAEMCLFVPWAVNNLFV